MYIEKLIENFITEQTGYMTELYLDLLQSSNKNLKSTETDLYNELLCTSEETFGDDLSYSIQEDLVKRIMKNAKKFAKQELGL